jgi:hypothetical protein
MVVVGEAVFNALESRLLLVDDEEKNGELKL